LIRQNKLRNLGGNYELDLRQGEMVRLGLAGGNIFIMIRYKAETPKPVVAPLLDLTASEVTGVILAGVIAAIFALYMSLYAPSNLQDEEAKVEEPIRKAIVTFNPPKVVEAEEPPKEKPKVVEVKEKAPSVKADKKSDFKPTQKQASEKSVKKDG